MNKVFILAGTHEQAKTLARWHDMAPSEWAYADDQHKLIGARQLTLWLYGTWHNNPKASEIVSMATARGFKIFNIYEDRP